MATGAIVAMRGGKGPDGEHDEVADTAWLCGCGADRGRAACGCAGSTSARCSRRRRPRPRRRRSRRRAACDPAPREWTGEDGASGHPLMQRVRHPGGGGEFPQLPRRHLAAGAAPQRAARRCSTSCMAGVTPDLRIMDLLDSQPEFTKAPWEYLDILVTDARIADGRAILAKHRAAFDRDGEGLRRRPPRHRGDLGHRIRTTARRSATAR